MLNLDISRTPPAAEIADLLQQELREHRDAFEATASMIDGPFIGMLDIVERSLRAGGKLLIFGNGGSAADAQHLAAELIIRYKADRPALSAIALTTESSSLTACANDLGFDSLFERQIDGLAVEHDVALWI